MPPPTMTMRAWVGKGMLKGYRIACMGGIRERPRQQRCLARALEPQFRLFNGELGLLSLSRALIRCCGQVTYVIKLRAGE